MTKINNKYNIGDKVSLISQDSKDIYLVYSITINYNGDLTYTIWKDTDYESVSEWQIMSYVPPEPIGLQTKE